MTISDEAVEAAHKAWREQAALDGSIFEYNLRAALEAAAPHMLAPVIDLSDELAASELTGDSYLIGRGSGFRIAGIRIRQVLGLTK